MRGWLRALGGTCAFFSLLAACGLDDSVVTELGGGPLDASDTGANDTGIFDGSSDVAVSDSGADAPPSPCPSLTICDDDASACGASQVCVPDIPAGWTLLGFDSHTQSSSTTPCGSSYAVSSTLEITDGGNVTCACSCEAGAPPTCNSDQVLLSTTTGCGSPAATEKMTSACTALGANFTVTNSVLEAQIQADPTTCAPRLDASIPADVLGAARECNFTGDAGTFCASHATCVAASGGSHTACVTQAYSGAAPPACGASCPTGFQSACFAVASGGTSDSRVCNSCTCGWSDPGCSGATVNASDHATCNGGSSHNIALAPATCAAYSLATVNGLGLTGTATTPTCNMTAPASSTGSFTASGESIVCCAN